MKKMYAFFAVLLAITLLLNIGYPVAIQSAKAEHLQSLAVASDTAIGVVKNTSANSPSFVGEGTLTSPYQITSKAQLNDVRNKLSACYQLQNDIIFTAADFASGGAFYNDGQGFLPIGSDSLFTGVFDGNGHTIRGLVGGLFGYLGEEGTIVNLKMEDGSICGIPSGTSQISGGIVRCMFGGLISNCNTSNSIQAASPTNAYAYAGGIVGQMSGGTISNCRNTGSVAAYAKTAYIAGIVAMVSGGTITDCVNDGDVSAPAYAETVNWSDAIFAGGIAGYVSDGSVGYGINTGDVTVEGSRCFTNVGGIVGYAYKLLNISDSYNTGDICGVSNNTRGCYVGGIAGLLYETSTIVRAYNIGRIYAGGISQTNAGGIVGRVGASSTINDTFNSGNVSAQNDGSNWSYAGGIFGSAAFYEIRNCYNVGDIAASGGSMARFGGIAGHLMSSSTLVSNCHYLNRTPSGVGGNETDPMQAATRAQLSEQQTFDGFDFSSVWTMEGNPSYPFPELQGMLVPGNLVTSLQITNPEGTLAQGETLQMQVLVLPDNADDQSVHWTIVPGTGSATISEDGLLSAAKVGTVTVYADANDSGIAHVEKQIQIIGDCIVSFDSRGGSAVISQTVAFNGLVPRPTDPTRVGGTFVGWYKEPTCVNLWDFDTDRVTTDTTIYAKWDISFYTVTFDSQGGSSVANQTVTPNGYATWPTRPVREGYNFGGWYTQPACTTSWFFSSDKVTDDITLYAKWNIITYSVAFDSRGGSAVANQTIDHNGLVTRPADPLYVGYLFLGWYKESTFINQWDFDTDRVTVDTTLYAGWSYRTYKLTFNSQGGSQVSSQSIKHNDFVTRPTDPTRTGYTFGGWYKESNCINPWNFNTDRVTAATTLFAKWTDSTYPVVFDSQGGSAVTSQTIQHNGLVIRPADPTRAGHTFGGWYRESYLWTLWNFVTDRVTASTTLYAKWTIKTYTVTFNSQGGSSVDKQIVNYDELIYKPSSPIRTGYIFAGWYKEAAGITAWNFATGKVATNTTLYAKWTPFPTPASPKATPSYNSIQVTWRAVGGADGYEVWYSYSYGTEPDSDYMLLATVDGTSFTETNPAVGIAYHYKIRAYRTVDGVTNYSFYTAVVSASPSPAAPTSPKATAMSYSSVQVTWNASDGAGGYEVWRSTTAGSGYQLAATTAAANYNNTGLSTGTTYYYKIRAYRTVSGVRNYSGYSSVVSAKPALGVPASPKATAASYNSVKLTWSAAAGAGGYEVWRSTTSGSGYMLTATVVGTSSTSTGLSTGTTYYYKIRAYRTVNGSKVYGGYSSVVSARTVPATPTGTKATAVSYNSIKLTWSAAAGAGGYEVWRSTTAGSGYMLTATVAGTSSTSTGLSTGTTYYYKIRAYRTANGSKVHGGYSSVVSARTVPATPVAPKATAVSYNSVKLTWSAAAGASGYEVWRSTGSSYTLTATVATTSYTNTGLATGTTYYYKIRAYRTINGVRVFGIYSAVVSAKPVPATPTGVKVTAVSYNSIKLTWNTAGGAGSYEVWRSTTVNSGYSLKVFSVGTSYTNNGLATGTTYYYKIRVYRTVNGIKVYSPYSTVVSAKPMLTTPGSPKATVISHNSVMVTWDAAAGAGGYEVWRSTTASSGYKLAATVAGTSSTSTSLATGTTYYYKIRAYRTVNGVKVYGGYSAVVSAKP